MKIEDAIAISRASQHSWGDETAAGLRRRFRYENFFDFLDTIKTMCGFLCSVDALERTARWVSEMLGSHGVVYAEVYTSPLIYQRWGLRWSEVSGALEEGFAEGEDEGGARCMILLDSVRQWGPDAAHEVLGLQQNEPCARVIGFGLGGEESVDLVEFLDVYERARDLGLRTTVHAGETGEASDVAFAIEKLRVDRVAHGIRCLDDASVLDLVRDSKTPLDLAVSSNYRTRVVRGIHPIGALLGAGLTVTLGTDDPTLFGTDPERELRRAICAGNLGAEEAMSIITAGVEASFAPANLKDVMRAEIRNFERSDS